MGILDGKTGLILNIANDRSIAWHIAANAIKQGARCGFGFLPIEKMERRVRKAMEEGGFANEWLQPCDVGSDESIEKFFAGVRDQFGTIDFLVHSLAFANRDYLKIGNFLSTPRDVYKQAIDISAYSLVALTRGAVPLMPNGGSIVALTYFGSEKVVPGYNVMGVAKAALESSIRYLAYDLGKKNIRVNGISSGPISTLAARGVPGFTKVLQIVRERSPLPRNTEPAEVGDAALFLCSHLSRGVTGEVIFVDNGYHIMGM